jgi:plastocyanin
MIPNMRNVSVHMRWLLALCVAAAACGGSDTIAGTTGGNNNPGTGGNPQPTATTSVSMNGLQFRPAAILVSKGATVTWTNQDNTAHNVTFSDNSVVSIGDFSTGTKSTVMPSTAGTFSYRCTIHPGMNGTVTVQ